MLGGVVLGAGAAWAEADRLARQSAAVTIPDAIPEASPSLSTIACNFIGSVYPIHPVTGRLNRRRKTGCRLDSMGSRSGRFWRTGNSAGSQTVSIERDSTHETAHRRYVGQADGMTAEIMVAE
jgi:hypothetical protein